MGYPFQHPDIDGVVIGTDNPAQIQSNMAMACNELDGRIREQVESIRVAETELLNPSNWNR